MDDEKIETKGGNRYFRNYYKRIRRYSFIRRNFYQQVTDIYATSIDYDPRSDLTKNFLQQCKINFIMQCT